MEEDTTLLTQVLRYSLFLYVGTMTVSIALRLPPAFAVPKELRVTCASFAVATLVMQKMLARVLERTPAQAPRLTPLAAWPLAVFTWLFVTLFFVSYLSFVGHGGYFARSCSDWAAAGVASAVNLAMAARTVADYLA